MTNAQKKQAIGFAIALAILVAAFFGLRYYNRSSDEKQEQAEEAAKIYVVSADAENITTFSWRSDGETVTMVKEDGAWTCSEHPEYEIDADKVEALLEELTSLEASQIVEDPEDGAVYGFADPENVITYGDGEKEVTLTIGMENTITGGYYVKSSADDTVYLIDSSVLSTFDCDASTLEKEQKDSAASDTVK